MSKKMMPKKNQNIIVVAVLVVAAVVASWVFWRTAQNNHISVSKSTQFETKSTETGRITLDLPAGSVLTTRNNQGEDPFTSKPWRSVYTTVDLADGFTLQIDESLEGGTASSEHDLKTHLFEQIQIHDTSHYLLRDAFRDRRLELSACADKLCRLPGKDGTYTYIYVWKDIGEHTKTGNMKTNDVDGGVGMGNPAGSFTDTDPYMPILKRILSSVTYLN